MVRPPAEARVYGGRTVRRHRWVLAALIAWGAPSARADTLVVAVDTSASMATTDPDRLAVLALLMLADVVDPVVDDLVVVPFDDGPATPGASSQVAPIARSDHPDTARFRDALSRAVTQDGRRTLFAPQIRKALDVLDQRQDPGRKVLVVLTDGGSTAPREDLAVLETELLPRLRRAGAQAWFVSLGSAPGAQPALSRFFTTNRLGGTLEAPHASDLPGVLAAALARGTGRVVHTMDVRPGQRVPLDSSPELAEVSIVAIAAGAVDARAFSLTPPSGTWTAGIGDDVEGLVTGGAPHGYRRVRVVAPTQGRWRLDVHKPLGLVILERYAYSLDLAPVGRPEIPPGRHGCVTATLRSVARPGAPPQPVTSPTALAGLDIRLALSDATSGRTRTPLTLLDDGVAPSDKIRGDGVFGGCLVPREQDAGASLIAVAELSSGGAVWATSAPIGLDVLPVMRLGTTPQSVALGSGGALSTGDRACATVELLPPTGQLPADPTALRLSVWSEDATGAWVAGTTAGPGRALQVQLDGALLPPDGREIDVSWSPSSPAHEVCVVVGRRDRGGTLDLRVRLAPAAAAFRDAGVEGWVDVSAVVETPTPWERWGLTVITLGLLSTFMGAVAYLRSPVPLPAGMTVLVWADGTDRPSHAALPLRGDGRRRLARVGVRVRVRGDRVVVTADHPVARRRSDGTWEDVRAGEDGLDVAAGVTYRLGDTCFRFGWGET